VAATVGKTSNPPTDRWHMLGGDRFYTFARWLVIALLFAVTLFLTGEQPWLVAGQTRPIIFVLWAYTAFSVLATLALFAPFLNSLLNLAYIFDIAFISLMAFLGGEQTVIFFPLYLLPLISAALRQSPATSLLSGLIAAIFYIGACLAYQRLLPESETISGLEYLSLALRGLTLTSLPWLTSGLAERWTESNRRSVVVAEQQAERALADARAYRDQMRSLYGVAYDLSTMDYRHILESTLREGRKLVPYTVGMALLSSGRPDELYIAAHQSLSVGDQTRKITLSNGAIATTLRASEAQILADPHKDVELAGFDSLRGCKVACLIPLRAHLRNYGLLLIASNQQTSFTGEQVEMLTTLTSYAIIALHNAHLIFDLKEERNKLISKEEEVRHQLARDLHDGPAQALAAITMNIEFIKKIMERDPKRVNDELDKLSVLSKRTTYEVRTMLFELRPLVLETQGLKVTLEQYLERFKENNTSNTKILLETDGVDDVNLDTKTEGTLFNIIQEGVNNALKHAKARHIWVRLKKQGKTLNAIVQDDGEGFDKAAVMKTYEKRGSFGLLNIDERARLVGGHANLESTIGKGTIINIVVPIEQ
jgi:signal transduction histidine kinase